LSEVAARKPVILDDVDEHCRTKFIPPASRSRLSWWILDSKLIVTGFLWQLAVAGLLGLAASLMLTAAELVFTRAKLV